MNLTCKACGHSLDDHVDAGCIWSADPEAPFSDCSCSRSPADMLENYIQEKYESLMDCGHPKRFQLNEKCIVCKYAALLDLAVSMRRTLVDIVEELEKAPTVEDLIKLAR